MSPKPNGSHSQVEILLPELMDGRPLVVVVSVNVGAFGWEAGLDVSVDMSVGVDIPATFDTNVGGFRWLFWGS